MSFGKNPFVAKAQAAEQKAQLARDEAARTLAWREAARLWDRAAEREVSEARKQEYADKAEAARAAADADAPHAEDVSPDELTEPTAPPSASGSRAPSGKPPAGWLN